MFEAQISMILLFEPLTGYVIGVNLKAVYDGEKWD